MFDPEKFGEAMGAAIRDAVAPLLKRVSDLEFECKRLRTETADEHAQVKATIAALPSARDGKDAEPIDIEVVVRTVLEKIPKPADGKDGEDGKDGKDGIGEKGADGLGLAGAMIDRDGALQITLTNGEVKSLGLVVGRNGTDGKDGLSLEAFELEYLPESHEIALKATAAGRVKELRYPAGGIRPAGYWREGTRAKAGEAWVNDGSLWIAVKDCQSKPGLNDEGWIIAARKGRDGERGRDFKAADTAPIKLGT